MFDLTKKNTMLNIESWITKITQYFNEKRVNVTQSKIPIILMLGNKSDLVDRDITTEEITHFQKILKSQFLNTNETLLHNECNLFNLSRIDQAFTSLCRQLIDRPLE